MAYKPNSGPGTHDASLEFCTAQSVPTDGAQDISENIIDLIDTAPDLRGTPLILCVEVTTKITTASGTSSQMYINLLTDAAASTISGGWVTLSVGLIMFTYTEAKGQVFKVGIPQYGADAYERYLSLVLAPVSSDTLYSAGAIDAWLEPAI